MTDVPVIWWVRRDLRVTDNPALVAAAARGRVIPVFILDEAFDGLGAAAKMRLGLGLEEFDAALRARGSRLVLRRGAALEVLRAVVAEVGARAVHWARCYDPEAIARDTLVKAGLKSDGFEAESHGGHVLFEPWTVQTGQGGMYKVYTPFWNNLRGRDPGVPLSEPKLRAPAVWPVSDQLEAWDLAGEMKRGAAIVRKHMRPGESAAFAALDRFMDGPVEQYKDRRDFPAVAATSQLSEYLTYGEISARSIWSAGQRATLTGALGGEQFLKELVWREFAYHLMYHSPHILSESWRAGWERFPWSKDAEQASVLAWKQGRTGVEFVDAAMREMYVTGKMHNRARMIVASYLTKHLMVDWRVGRDWFAECLTDWDIASNAMGWQWVAGCGPDAAPFFRVFNPETQAKKFDPDMAYRRRWIAEGQSAPSEMALAYFDAVPQTWGLSAQMRYPETPIVALKAGREAALAAFAARQT
ncbi:MAG: cryptochrome/photolyase family protein [Maritimibacter sp.]